MHKKQANWKNHEANGENQEKYRKKKDGMKPFPHANFK